MKFQGSGIGVELFFLPSPLSPRPHRKGLGTKLTESEIMTVTSQLDKSPTNPSESGINPFFPLVVEDDGV